MKAENTDRFSAFMQHGLRKEREHMPATKRAATVRTPKPRENAPLDTGVELWRNVTKGVVVITRTAEYGRRVFESITGGRAFQVTPAERRNMQNSAASEDLDIFTNGALQPVSLVDGEPDNDFLLQNPNVLDDNDIPKLLRLRGEAFADRVNEITQMAAITRLLEIARDSEYDMTVPQYEVVKRRERTLKVQKEGLIEPEGADTGEDVPKPVTPR